MNRIHADLQPNISLANLIRARITENRLTVPVARSVAPYARLRNVSGIASSQGSGYPLSKLQALDILVERLKNIRGIEIAPEKPDSGPQLDAMVEEYSKKLHQAFVAADSNPYLDHGNSLALMLSISV